MQINAVDTNIAGVHQADIEKARKMVRKAVTQASDAWISIPAISDALMLEFVELAGRCISPSQLADHLISVAHQLEQAQERAN